MRKLKQQPTALLSVCCAQPPWFRTIRLLPCLFVVGLLILTVGSRRPVDGPLNHASPLDGHGLRDDILMPGVKAAAEDAPPLSQGLLGSETGAILDGDWNLVVIAVDTLRADMLGSYGSDEGLTPHLDRLAADGWRLADLNSPAPWTLPSFATLMTGLQPQTHGAGHRMEQGTKVRRDSISGLHEGHTTLAESLSKEGFRTAGFYSNVFLNPSFGMHQGFDTYREFDPLTRAGEVVDETLDWLRHIDEERFFLFAHIFDPHSPYRPPPDAWKYLAEDDASGATSNHSSLAENALRGPQIPPQQRAWAASLYRAEIAYADEQIGRLLTAIAERSDPTLILLISDHGEELWEREAQRHALGYHPRAGHGHSHYQELLHVPAILAIPGAAPGEILQGTEMADLFPTVLGLLGVVPPPNQGRDLRPQLAGAKGSEPLRLSAFQLYGARRWSARQGPWKVVVKPGSPEAVELYHLLNDPAERHDLSQQRPGIARSLRYRGETELLRRADSPLKILRHGSAANLPLAEPELEALQSLGYL